MKRRPSTTVVRALTVATALIAAPLAMGVSAVTATASGPNSAPTKAVTTISTSATSRPLGDFLVDQATLGGGNAPTGTITWTIYGPNDPTCSGTPVDNPNGDTADVIGNYPYTSPPFVPNTAGTYRWIASYSGDANNLPVSGACNDANEASVVPQDTPAISTTAMTSVVSGASFHDTADITGGADPTGTLTFDLYGPNDPTCSSSPVGSSEQTISGDGTYPSAGFGIGQPGTYRWIAIYGGDANNTSVSTACNAADETTQVSDATPTLTSATAATAGVGSGIRDTATLSGGFEPTGTITFTLYGPDDATCSNTPLSTTTTAVTGSNGAYTSPATTVTVQGTYRWVASYGGDSNNIATTGACNDAHETAVVGRATPTGSATTSAGGTVGVVLSDALALSGGDNPTGTVTFDLFGPNDPGCAGTPAATSTVTVSGDGQLTSSPFTTTLAGTYRWTWSYSGDSNNTAVTGACDAPGQVVDVDAVATVSVPSTGAGLPLGTSLLLLLGGTLLTIGSAGLRERRRSDATD